MYPKVLRCVIGSGLPERKQKQLRKVETPHRSGCAEKAHARGRQGNLREFGVRLDMWVSEYLYDFLCIQFSLDYKISTGNNFRVLGREIAGTAFNHNFLTALYYSFRPGVGPSQHNGFT
jgi:hypothetical protein